MRRNLNFVMSEHFPEIWEEIRRMPAIDAVRRLAEYKFILYDGSKNDGITYPRTSPLYPYMMAQES